jgi:hypothetical protein
MARPRLSAAEERRKAKRREDMRGYAIIGACFAVLIAAGLLGWTVLQKPPLDPHTGCPVDHRTLAAHTVILIDETDELSRDELRYAKSLIMTEYSWLPIGGRLTVRNIVEDPDLGEDIVVCRMEDGSHSLGLVSNRRKLRQDFQRIVGARLEDLFTALRMAKPQKYSPILEYIAAVFDRPDFGKNIKERRVVLLSDMAQHSKLFSQYRRHRGGLPADTERELHRDMTGAHVRIHYIVRPKLRALQTEAHRRFWIEYLRGQGADVALGHELLIGEDPNRETWNDES